MFKTILTLCIFIFASIPAMAGDSLYALPAAELSLLWVSPFVGILLSLAFMPLLLPRIWHHHYGKIALFWSTLAIFPMAAIHGIDTATYSVLHTFLLEYIPFILVATVLFTTTGGIKIQLSAQGTPLFNTAFLAATCFIASFIGTTGAAMLFIRPLLAVNKSRETKSHIVLFFIILVCNVGGSLTALGDPPLFLGFLKGIPFFWPLTHLFVPFLIVGVPVLVLFLIVDTYFFTKQREGLNTNERPIKNEFKGGLNLFLLVLVVLSVVISGTWKPGIAFHIMDVTLELQNIARDLSFLMITLLSFKFTSSKIRKYNAFSWEPMLEVAKLFACIFITAMPVIAMLGAGIDGALAPVVGLVTHEGQPNNLMYFWLTGVLSSFLDNAPTYLVFFYMAGGDAHHLAGEMSLTLTAISAGAVFMGALTYIGNAPNFLVKSIAETSQIKMPSFFAYAGLASLILFPTFVLLSWFLF